MKQYINGQCSREFANCISKIIRKQIAQRPIDVNDISFGLAGNTFRAYRTSKSTPSQIFRTWAKKNTEQLAKRQPTECISTREGFLKWHWALYSSLQRRWKKSEGKQLPLAHCYKLVDLYIKWISAHKFEDKAFIDAIVKNANCPLDRQVLERLNECYSLVLPIFKPSMGHIHNQNTYVFCQELIAEFSEHCGGSRLLFDYWTWRRGNV